MKFSNPFPGICTFHCEEITSYSSALHSSELVIANQFKAEKRRKEFISGRRCAQIALHAAHIPKLPILRESNRSPCWPFSIVGSITHGAGYAAAIIGKYKPGIVGIGLDMEDLSREIKSNITRHVLTQGEIERWLGGKEHICREVRIIFSIKEAIYKCFFPIAGVYLGFQDAEVDEINETHFKARLLKSPLPGRIKLPMKLQGKLIIQNSTILSAIKAEIEDFEA